MTRIIKCIWKWDEKYNSIGIKLGDDISDLISKRLVKKTKDDDEEYNGNDCWPWKVRSKKEKVISISFREKFFYLIKDELWDLEYREFVKVVDEKFIIVSEIEDGDSLYLVFRGGFIAIAMIIRK